MRTMLMVEELNSFIAKRDPRRPSLDFCFKLRHLGWKEWQFVAYDEELDRLVFFDTFDELSKYEETRIKMLMESMERTKYISPDKFWELVGEIENRIESLEVLR